MKLIEENPPKNKALNILLKIISLWLFISGLVVVLTSGVGSVVDEWIVYYDGFIFSPEQIGALFGFFVVCLITYIAYRFLKWSWKDVKLKKK